MSLIILDWTMRIGTSWLVFVLDRRTLDSKLSWQRPSRAAITRSEEEGFISRIYEVSCVPLCVFLLFPGLWISNNDLRLFEYEYHSLICCYDHLFVSKMFNTTPGRWFKLCRTIAGELDNPGHHRYKRDCPRGNGSMWDSIMSLLPVDIYSVVERSTI